ncbi:MAG: nuclear transport factor 2 family protein [Bryobacterales bacterium]|nr:nuclear transport factor 2 family protein [Bryobacterales bacterium]
MKLLLACLVMVSAVAADDDIRAAEKAWGAALVARDGAALEKIYTPELIYAHSTGKVETKAQYMERLKGGKQRYDSVTHESTQVVRYGDSAVAHSIARMTGRNDAGPFDDHLMILHLWVRQGGGWRLAAHQTTKIR